MLDFVEMIPPSQKNKQIAGEPAGAAGDPKPTQANDHIGTGSSSGGRGPLPLNKQPRIPDDHRAVRPRLDDGGKGGNRGGGKTDGRDGGKGKQHGGKGKPSGGGGADRHGGPRGFYDHGSRGRVK